MATLTTSQKKAAEQVVKLKDAYMTAKKKGASASDLNAISSQASNLRKTYGLSESTYGEGVTSAQAKSAIASSADGGDDRVRSITVGTPNTQTADATVDRSQRLYEAQQRAAQAALEAKRQAGLSAIQKQREAIPDIYNQQRARATGASATTGRTFQQLLAEKGISGGASAEAAMQQASDLRGQLGTIDATQSQALSNLAEQERLVQQGYATDLAETQNTLLAQQIKDQIDQDNADRLYKLQLAGATGYLDGQQTLAGKRAEIELQNLQNELDSSAWKTQGEKDKLALELEQLGYETQKAKFIVDNYSALDALEKEKIRADIAATNRSNRGSSSSSSSLAYGSQTENQKQAQAVTMAKNIKLEAAKKQWNALPWASKMMIKEPTLSTISVTPEEIQSTYNMYYGGGMAASVPTAGGTKLLSPLEAAQ